MPKLLVTGASGFLGGAVVAAARVAGWEVAGTALTQPGWIGLDVRDGVAVEALVAEVAPDAIIHTAYVQHGEEAMAVNAGGAGHVAAAARSHARPPVRLVHVSSDAIFAGDGDRALREGDVVAPVTVYGATKAAAEVAVRDANPDALLVRTSLLVGGPGHAPSPHEKLALAVARGEQQMTFFTDEIRSPIQVDDLAAALVELAAQDDLRGPLHVGGADGVSRLELARLVIAAAGFDPASLAGVPAPADRPRHCPMDSSRAQTRLRTRLRGVREIYGG
jgi:dTDP-4-dehydrorhamnose reductase